MDIDILLQILADEGYPSFMIDATVQKINNMDSCILAIFKDWHQSGVIPQLDICGYSFTILINQYKMKPVGAFITLDWLKRDPDNAVKALNRGIR